MYTYYALHVLYVCMYVCYTHAYIIIHVLQRTINFSLSTADSALYDEPV